MANSAIEIPYYVSKDGSPLTGATVQILFTVKRVADMSYMYEDVIQLIWGRTYLRDLPIVLNLRQNLETGENGLEQTGTTKKVGQQTLEMR